MFLALSQDRSLNLTFNFMKKRNQDRVIHFLCHPQGGQTYLLNALNSNSERIFIEALHNVIDAISQDLASTSA